MAEKTMNGSVGQVIPSYCSMCHMRCQIQARVAGGAIVRIEGKPDGYNQGRLCPRGNAGIMHIYDMNRVLTPLKRTNPRKGLGVDPGWVNISWEEAYSLIAEKLRQVRQEDPYLLRAASYGPLRPLPVAAFAYAFGTPHVASGGGGSGGISCGNGTHMLGRILHASFRECIDYEHCNLMMLFGANSGFEAFGELSTDAGRNADARARGMKLVVVDPRFSAAAAKATEWVPIRPGTDAALALGMLNVLINELGIYDAPFLKTHTNAPYLVGSDGYFVRDRGTGKPLVWDSVAGVAKPFNHESITDMALEGEYQVYGETSKPAFQRLKEHVREYTPQRVEEITTVPAETVRRLARLWGEEARIGSTIVLEGKEFPYRPAALTFYRGVHAQKHSTMNAFSLALLAIVVGAVDVPGGTVRLPPGGESSLRVAEAVQPDPDGLVRFTTSHYQGLVRAAWPPRWSDLRDWFPISHNQGHVHHLSAREPERYGFKGQPVNLQHHSNPFITMADPKALAESFSRTYNIISDIVLSETTEFADIFIPDSTYLEQYYIGGPHKDYRGLVFQQPAVSAINGIPDFIDVLVELAERLGCLYGPGGMNDWLNMQMDLSSPYKLELDQRYSWQQVVERALLTYSKGEHGLDWFQETGADMRPAGTSKYMPWKGARIPIYVEFLKKTGDELHKFFADNNVEEKIGMKWDLSDYVPLPSWRPTLAHQAPPEYDMFAINYKSILCTHGRGANNPWLMELMEKDPWALKLVLNRATAQKKGIKEGDAIWVESPVGRVKGVATLSEGIHPDCIGFAAALGHWAKHSIAQGKGANFNSLCSLSLEATDMVSGALENVVAKVKVYKAKPATSLSRMKPPAVP